MRYNFIFTRITDKCLKLSCWYKCFLFYFFAMETSIESFQHDVGIQAKEFSKMYCVPIVFSSHQSAISNHCNNHNNPKITQEKQSETELLRVTQPVVEVVSKISRTRMGVCKACGFQHQAHHM
jgi:hypothetical protein